MQLDAWGEPMWKQDAGQWLNRRSEDAEVCVTESKTSTRARTWKTSF